MRTDEAYIREAIELASVRGTETSGIACSELAERKGGNTTVEGTVLESDGLAVHEEYD